MFTLFSGPFHPHLESKLVEAVQQIKVADSRTPFAIVVPSESLRRRLQWLLCVEHHCALFDVHFLTFHQLALRLDAERRAVARPETPVSSFELVGEFFYEYLLSNILQQDVSPSNPFAFHSESSGLSSALWRTIQDLREAQVEPQIALRAMQEGLFEEAAIERLKGVFGHHARLQAWSEKLGVGLPDDLTHSVTPWVRESPFIAKLSSVLYYGFYDITQVQLSLLEAVARVTSVTVFFPLFQGEASQFAQRFFDRHLLKAGVINQAVQDSLELSPSEPVKVWTPAIQVVNAVGPEGEITFACKAIVQHVEELGYAWHEIGVVARNFEPYLSYFPRICKAHRIPFGTTATRPMLEEPMAKVWWTLAGLREERFGWRSMLDVVATPWYRSTVISEASVSTNINVWVEAVHHFRIVGGREDWARLSSVAQDSAAIQEWQAANDLSLEQASESLQIFAETINVLIEDYLALPVVGSIGELTQAFEGLVEKYLCLPTDLPPFAEDAASDTRNECLMNGFEEAVCSLRQLDCLGQLVTWEQWLKLFRSMLERTQLPLSGQTSMGVQVLDVMAARGRPFRVIFVLGMNDHVFPRVVREDAFLRDRDRKVLAESLGYKIDEKMTGFDEETLLFALLQQSAQDYVYFLYQRADLHGRPLIPSSFLRNHVIHAGAQHVDSERTFPVGLLEQSHVSYFLTDHATSQETRLRLVLEGKSLQAMVSHESPWWNLFQHGMEVMAHLEWGESKAGPFDGMTDANSWHWQDLVSRGLSPTALGIYAQCPMRYWMGQVLKLQGARGPLSKEFPSRMWGELVHSVLCQMYQDLSLHGWPQHAINPVELSGMVKSKMNDVFQEYAQRFGKGYELIWEWMRTRLTRMMCSLIDRDHSDFIEQGWIPVEYEAEAVGALPREDHAQAELLNIRGRFDRVDKLRDQSRVRIVDYKISMRRSFRTDELDLVTKALQGRQLQPPLYSFMTPINLKSETGQDETDPISIQSVDFLYLRPMQEESVRSASFSGAIWDTATGEQLRRTIYGWIQEIRAGQFFILPGTYCQTCQYASACRFQHHPSWLRAYVHPLAKTYRQIRKQKVSDD